MRPRLPSMRTPRRPVLVAALAAALVVVVVLAVTLGSVRGRDRGWSQRTVDLGEDASLTLRIPDDPGPHPVLLHVPGGGWTEIDETPVGDAFGHDEAVEAGWALATVRYRTGQDRDPATVSAADQVDDVTAVLTWIRESGPGVGLDDTLVAMGHSAGAHLLAVATARAHTGLQADSLVLVAGVYDFADDVRGSPMLVDGLRDAVGCDGDRCSAKARLEPARWADPQDPPVAIVHGTDDTVAPVASAYRYATALRSAGVATSVRIVEGGRHRGTRLDATVRGVLRRAMRQATDERSNR